MPLLILLIYINLLVKQIVHQIQHIWFFFKAYYLQPVSNQENIIAFFVIEATFVEFFH